MPVVELPGGKSAVLLARSEITQRSARRISQSMMASASIAARLNQSGMDTENPATWSVFGSLSDEEMDLLNRYQSDLIIAFVKQWDVMDELPTLENVLDMPQGIFEVLAEKCQEEFNNVPEYGPDGVADPLVVTEGSAN